MAEKITVSVTSDSNGPIKKITLSKPILMSLTFFFLVGIAVAAVWMVDYFTLRQQYRTSPSTGTTAGKPAVSSERLWAHIKKLDYDINRLKTKLAGICVLEEKLREMAGGALDTHTFPGGVGGPLPEDLDPLSALDTVPGEHLSQLRRQMRQLEQTTLDRTHTLQSLLKLLKQRREIFSRTPSEPPTPGRISSRYGWRRSPFSGRREFHDGIDIAIYKGAPVTAPADGTVKAAGRRGSLGRVLVIDHGYGVVTRYGHLSRILKKPGDFVQRGEVVARVGTSGRSTGPHLHYEILVGGAPVDPKRFMFN